MNSVVDINSYCKQRKLRLQYNVPITRFTKVSPYGLNLTKHDLDMRRKAEVLKHSGPQKSTQTNKLTKAQMFAQTVRGYSPQQKNLDPFTGKFKAAELAFCDSSLNHVSTSSSDVPVQLHLSIWIQVSHCIIMPPDRTFSENVKENELPFRFFVNSDNSLFSPGISQNIGALEILDKIPNSSTVFELVVPYTQGTISNDPVLYVTYSGSPILINNYTYHYTSTGTLLIKNITLYTTAGYFFEFALQFNDESIKINTEGITIYNP